MAVENMGYLVEALLDAMRQQADEAHTKRAQIDVSGGIDSAVVAALSCRAFGPDNVVGVYSSIQSSGESERLAEQVAEKFGFPLVKLDLTDVYSLVVDKVHSEFKRLDLDFPSFEPSPATNTIFGSLRSCLRAPVGRFVNRVFGGGVRQGTGNRDEDELLRFYQKGGDGEVDCNWIAGLFKSEVWELAKYLGVPKDIINAMPTPDLWGDGDKESSHTDEDELEALTGVKLTYTRPGEKLGTIEWVSRENERNGCVNGQNETTSPAELGYNADESAIVEAVRRMEKMTRHKAVPPPCLERSELIAIGAVE